MALRRGETRMPERGRSVGSSSRVPVVKAHVWLLRQRSEPSLLCVIRSIQPKVLRMLINGLAQVGIALCVAPGKDQKYLFYGRRVSTAWQCHREQGPGVGLGSPVRAERSARASGEFRASAELQQLQRLTVLQLQLHPDPSEGLSGVSLFF